MTDVLILGGTGWLSGRVAHALADAGASVTCLARGGAAGAGGAELVVADRDEPGAYDEVAAREWDEIVDISSTPSTSRPRSTRWPRATQHWTYISTLSVYAGERRGRRRRARRAAHSPPAPARSTTTGARRRGPRHPSARRSAIRAAIVRPGLIVGPGDPTDRFGYWVGRFALAGGEPVLVPDARGTAAPR